MQSSKTLYTSAVPLFTRQRGFAQWVDDRYSAFFFNYLIFVLLDVLRWGPIVGETNHIPVLKGLFEEFEKKEYILIVLAFVVFGLVF